MNEQLIKNYNEVVKRGDVVWFLGDFAFMNITQASSILRRLNGQKNLILGNHDKNIRNKSASFMGKGLLHSIHDYREIYVEKQSIVLSHYGMRVWNKHHHGAWMLHGHSHGSLPPYGRSVDVGVDSTYITDEYRPVSFEEVKRFMQTRESVNVDHHN